LAWGGDTVPGRGDGAPALFNRSQVHADRLPAAACPRRAKCKVNHRLNDYSAQPFRPPSNVPEKHARSRTWNIRMKLWRAAAAIAIAGRRTQRRFSLSRGKVRRLRAHNSVDLIRPAVTPIWQLEHRMRCKRCSEDRGYPYKRGHLVRLRRSKVTTKNDGEPWYRSRSFSARDVSENGLVRCARHPD
jgi:hypothetical protein